MSLFLRTLFFLLLFSLSACSTSKAPVSRVKIAVAAEGLYRVPVIALQAAGIPADQLIPRPGSCTMVDQEIAIRVQGRGREHRSSSRTVERLAIFSISCVLDNVGAGQGQTDGPGDFACAHACTAGDFSGDRQHVGTNTVCSSGGESGKPMVLAGVARTGTTTTVTIEIAILGARPGSSSSKCLGNDARCRKSGPSHASLVQRAMVSGRDVGWARPPSSVWFGNSIRKKQRKTSSGSVRPATPKPPRDITLLSSVAVTYTRRFVAEQDQLAFESGGGHSVSKL